MVYTTVIVTKLEAWTANSTTVEPATSETGKAQAETTDTATPIPAIPNSILPPVKYANRSPAEDDKLIGELMKLILDNNIGNITTSHILAASPDLRVRLQNYLRNCRVEIHHLTQYNSLYNSPRPALVVGEEVLSLREVEVLVNGSVKSKGTLDDGCQLVTVCEDLWMDMQNKELDPTRRMVMEGADTTLSQTMGKIKNLPITIGGITFYVQAQVVRRSPTRLLLGMTFRALANCHTDVYPDGFTTLTLTDPNPPNATITVATTERITSQNEGLLCEASDLELKSPGTLMGSSTDARS